MSGWALDARVIELLIDRLYILNPSIIVEFGSGSSTLHLAQWAMKNDSKLISLEHLERFANYTRELCNGLPVDLRCVPLVNGFYKTQLPSNIDFVLIDGPPGVGVGRSKTLPHLWDNLSDSFEIWLDDANREHEKDCLQDWRNSYPIEVAIEKRGKGLAIIRRKNV